MLVKYRSSHNKVAQGLLSLMPKEQELKHLQLTMQRYQQDPNWEMYLWKEDEKYIGIIGISIQKDEFLIQHLAVIPSFRGEGVGKAMISEIQKIYSEYRMTAIVEIEAFIDAVY
ncbi:GNAT family N-acetyltransferase [Carnobacterium sp. ISL-102]|uniref:GNAT family N-acetyltransferase n=1 Tax=Carnobacterium sp. ISL-102 TaxID=2819142 RepID=UPI001BE9ECAA|nr:GNAT family N-acetyltransferase [Carnobacterium sp. ISL-102]